MKPSQKGHKDAPIDLTPSPGLSGTSMSSKTPGRDIEDKWSLKMLNPYETPQKEALKR